MNSNNLVARLTEGDIAWAAGKREKALSSYLIASQIREGTPWQRAWASNALGVIYRFKGWKEKAKQQFNRTLSIDSGDTYAHGNLAYLALEAGLPEEANKLFQQTLEADPADEIARYFLSSSIANAEAPTDLAAEKGSGAKITVAVIPFALTGGNLQRLGVGEATAGLLASKLREQGALRVIPAETMAPLLQKRGIGVFQLSDSIAALNVGKILNADAVVHGSVQTFPHLLVTDIRVVNVKTQTLLDKEHAEVRGPNRFEKTAEQLSQGFLPYLKKLGLKGENR
jgi:tetratricopeptide (TPR) repeat protein